MTELEPRPNSSDPLEGLHKMSTTAGVATQDYVAINALAVASAVLGLATTLSLVGTPFIAIGLASIVAGIVALRQIGDSNGTQSGRFWAWGGILISLLFAGVVGVTVYLAHRSEQRQTAEVNQTIEAFGELVIAGKHQEAYETCTREFRDRVPVDEFVLTMRGAVNADTERGPLTRTVGNGHVNFVKFANGTTEAHTTALFYFGKSETPGRVVAILHKPPGDVWRVHNLVELFPPRRR
jgi:hypothetical protein